MTKLTKKRKEALDRVLRKTAFENNKKYIGRSVEVLIEKEKQGVLFGKTITFKVVKIKNPRQKLAVGSFVLVKINKASDFGLLSL